ncbi:MAG TPA: pirin family protein [Myxococcaceae bacterium]|nr:pirin family protein [Myxococcaceae bacterium]
MTFERHPGVLPTFDPGVEPVGTAAILLVIEPRPRDLGGFSVRRLLPAAGNRMVGPFIFLDHMGPAVMERGSGVDVRPHPHIALATVTYLFEGEIVHRDTLGSERAIHPGDVNWMLAGRGIAHSERSSPEERARGVRLHGIQSWVALPTAHEEDAPAFAHHPGRTLPKVSRDGAEITVIAGTAYGAESPVGVLSPTLYVDARLEPGALLQVDGTHPHRAVHVAEGFVQIGARRLGPGVMAILRPGADVVIESDRPARVMLLGGAPLDGERHIWWNFVSSSRERIERAKDDWRNGRFGKVPGDEKEFIPLPEG